MQSSQATYLHLPIYSFWHYFRSKTLSLSIESRQALGKFLFPVASLTFVIKSDHKSASTIFCDSLVVSSWSNGSKCICIIHYLNACACLTPSTLGLQVSCWLKTLKFGKPRKITPNRNGDRVWGCCKNHYLPAKKYNKPPRSKLGFAMEKTTYCF